MTIRGNPLLPILGGIVLLMAIFVWFQSGGDQGGGAVMQPGVPKAPAADADTPAETIRTLTANVAEMSSELEALRRENRELRQVNDEVGMQQKQAEERITQRLRSEMVQQENETRLREHDELGAVQALSARVEALSEAVSRFGAGAGASDIPVGLGLDDLTGAGSDGVVWIDPLDRGPAMDDGSGGFLETSTGLGGTETSPDRWVSDDGLGDRVTGDPTRRVAARAMDPTAPEPVRPYYTINNQATLTGATAFTALIGRVPIAGQVRDPMPIKVITGADNLAANGLEIPEVVGAVWGGHAIGDWTLACVRGEFDTITFIFEDGRIVTHEGEDGEPLAYLTDAFGNPCVAGERITNAPSYLGSRIALTAASAGAQAAAASETTTITSGAVGTTTTAVTGDQGRYVLGKTVSGGVDEVTRWMDARMQDSFDAIYVAPGGTVTVNVQAEIPIDYDPQGRKLRYVQPLDAFRRTALD